MAQWLSWLERRPVTAEVESSSLFWVACLSHMWVSDNNLIWDHSSAGRASALQAEGHRFEPYWSHFVIIVCHDSQVLESRNVTRCFASMHTIHLVCRSGGTGRRTGLKILRDLYSRTGSIPVCGRRKESKVLVKSSFTLFCWIQERTLFCAF